MGPEAWGSGGRPVHSAADDVSLERAIEQLEAEVADFRQGSPGQPKEGTPEWFLLRAKALGLSHLRRMQQLQLENDPAACERYYRSCSATFKHLQVPPEQKVVREVILPE